MTLRAAFVLPGHGQAAGRLEDVASMRVMALPAAQVAFNDLMMLRQAEFGVNVEVTLKTRRRVRSGVDDEPGAAAGFDVFAAGTVAGFAAGFADPGRIVKMNPGMRAGGKFADQVGVTIQAGPVADKMGAGNFQRHDDGARGGGTRNQADHQPGGRQGHYRGPCPFLPYLCSGKICQPRINTDEQGWENDFSKADKRANQRSFPDLVKRPFSFS